LSNGHVYRITEVVGTSEQSIDDAIRTAVQRASKTLRNLDWFTVEEMRGQLNEGDVAFFQVTLKVGFRLAD
jgi:flavin-binding protein dodecin